MSKWVIKAVLEKILNSKALLGLVVKVVISAATNFIEDYLEEREAKKKSNKKIKKIVKENPDKTVRRLALKEFLD